MPDYRRVHLPGGTFFFTLVTFNRRPIFQNPAARKLFYEIQEKVRAKHPFETVAFSLLLEHYHGLWRLPEGDSNYSLRLSEIKRQFSHRYIREIGPIFEKSASRVKREEVSLWQRRFWEHTIRNEDDLYNHIDYIHFNPVKHGLVECARDWSDSSFLDFVNLGLYEIEWGEGEKEKRWGEIDLGE
jgi:putative transposase